MSRETFATRLAYVVTAVWLGSIAVDAASSSYTVPITVHAVMMLVAGWAYGRGIVGRNGNE